MKLEIVNQKGNLDVTVDGQGAHLNLHNGDVKADFVIEWKDIQSLVNLVGDKLDEIAFGSYPEVSFQSPKTEILKMPSKVQDVN